MLSYISHCPETEKPLLKLHGRAKAAKVKTTQTVTSETREQPNARNGWREKNIFENGG
jgi:hypothetical protein